MSNKRRKGKAYRPSGRPAMNPMVLAKFRASTLEPSFREELKLIGPTALAGLRDEAADRSQHWTELADCFNIAEALREQGICSDDESFRLLNEGGCAVGSIAQRFKRTLAWSITEAEEAALTAGLERFHIQLDFCSLGELDRARATVNNLVREARNGGSVGRNCVVHSL